MPKSLTRAAGSYEFKALTHAFAVLQRLPFSEARATARKFVYVSNDSGNFGQTMFAKSMCI